MAKQKERYDDKKDNFSQRLRSLIVAPSSLEPFTAYLKSVLKTCTVGSGKYQQYEKALKDIESRGYITPEHITVVTGRNKSNVSRWISTEDLTIPNVQVATRLAKAFGVTTDYLLGVDASSDRKTAAEADVLKKYGIESASFKALQAFHDRAYAKPIDEKKTIDYDKAIEGLNLLLQQNDMDILVRIGYFLTRRRFDSYYYFDSDDVDELFSSVFDSVPAMEDFSKDHVKQCLNDFLTNSPQFSIDNFVLVSLDRIRDDLKEYKTKLDPDFFTPPDKQQFFEPKADGDNTDK